MGVPAGIKLNTELAGVLGMTSLNAIQIWSTLWIFVGFHITFFVKSLAILGDNLWCDFPCCVGERFYCSRYITCVSYPLLDLTFIFNSDTSGSIFVAPFQGP